MNTKNLLSKKRKILLAVVIVVVTLIYIGVGAVLFTDIQVLESPKVTVEIDLVEMNAEEIIIQSSVYIENPNKFAVIIKDIQVTTTDDQGSTVMDITFEGGTIRSYHNKTYSSTESLSFNTIIPETLYTDISGIVGLEYLGILKKTLPVEVSIITSLDDLINDIMLPAISLKGDFGQLTDEGVGFTTEITVTNPNQFELSVDDIVLEMITDQDDLVGEYTLDGAVIAKQSTTTLSGSGFIHIEALNAQTLSINLNMSASIMIAGVSKTLDLETDIEIAMPHIEDLFPSEIPTTAFIDADMKLTRNGFLDWGFTSYMTLELRNPNNIALIASDIVFSIYRVDGDQEVILGECCVNESIVGANNTTYVPAEIYIPIKSLITGHRLLLPQFPDGMYVVVRGNLTIPGLDFSIWAGVSGYQDLHLFT